MSSRSSDNNELVEPGKRSVFWKLSLITKNNDADLNLWKSRVSLYTEKSAKDKAEGSEKPSVDHPLSLNTNSSWKSRFEDEELRKIIGQDVCRTFPDIAFYRNELIQAKMRDILFVHAKYISKLSYRQGFDLLLIDYDKFMIFL